jgi:hypothetical protein
MNSLALHLASIAAAWMAMSVLCLRSSSQRHRMGLPELAPIRRRHAGAAATTLLAASLVAAVASDGPALGIVLWLCQAGLLGLVLTCLLPYKPGILLWPWPSAGKGWRHGRG